MSPSSEQGTDAGRRTGPSSAAAGPPILDELTGVYSIEYFEHQMRAQVAYALRHGTPLSLILFGVDYLDEMTGAFGPGAAEETLVRVAREVREHVRAEDVLARYGGGAFALLCLDTASDPAAFLATRIRQSVEGAGLSHRGMELPITISLGVATLCSDEAHSTMVHRAEEAFHRALAGGNRVVIAE